MSGTWLLVLVLAVLTFAAMVVLFRVPRAAGAAIGSALMLGLAGYAMQGEPAKPGAPRTGQERKLQEGPMLVEARLRLFDNVSNPRSYMVLADGFTRRGQYRNAAAILADATRKNPGDAEAWTALGNVLTAHAEGRLAAPARMAFARAAAADPGSVAPGFFLGVAELRAGKLIEAHKAWTAALRTAPENAPGRVEVAQRVIQLETLIRQIAAQ